MLPTFGALLHRGYLLLVLGSALLLGGSSGAQEADPDPSKIVQDQAPPGEPPSEVDEITVVGTQLDTTNIQDEAQAVSAFGMEDLDKANIVNVEALAFNVPGLHVGRQGQQVIVTLRGIGTENASPTGEPGVAYMLDGVNFARPAAAQVAFFDLDSVQVKRGPQGTKGGKNTTAGWISVTTRKPHDAFELTGDVQIGSLDQRRVRGALNLPINEYFSSRTSYFYENRDGYLENVFYNDDDVDAFDVDDFGIRQQFLFRPTESLETLFKYNYYTQGGRGSQVKLIPLRERTLGADSLICQGVTTRLPETAACYSNLFIETERRPGRGVPDRVLDITETNVRPPLADGSVIGDPTKIASNTISNQESLFYGFTSTTTWEVPELPFLGETQLKGIGAYQRTDLSHLQDFDATSLPIIAFLREEDTDVSSAELQWSSSGGEIFDWQISGFYSRLSSKGKIDLPVWRVLGINGEAFTDPIRGVQSNKNESFGIAAHTDWYLTDTFTLSLGARWSKDYREINVLRTATEAQQLGVALFGCDAPYNELNFSFEPLVRNSAGRSIRLDPPVDGQRFLVADVPTCDLTFRDLTGGAGLEWRPLEDHLFYLRADRGYKSGGYANFGFGAYQPETIRAYALGNKSSLFDGRLTVNAEVFYYDYKDLQITIIDGIALRAENAPEATIWGADLETNFEPIDALLLTASLGYLNSEFEEYRSTDPTNEFLFGISESCKFVPNQPGVCPVTPTDFSGNEFSRAPKLTVTLAAEYTFYVGDYGSLTPRIQYYWNDDTYYRAFNAPEDLQEAYHLTDIKLTWTSPSEDWSIEGFVTNLEDDPIYQNVLVGPSALDNPFNAWYGPTRLWGMRANFNY